MKRDIPAPGFRLTTGKRNPPAGDGAKYWVQLGCGWVDELAPWPASGGGVVWKWKGDSPGDWEVAAVRRDGAAKKSDAGRQADGSYE